MSNDWLENSADGVSTQEQVLLAIAVLLAGSHHQTDQNRRASLLYPNTNLNMGGFVMNENTFLFILILDTQKQFIPKLKEEMNKLLSRFCDLSEYSMIALVKTDESAKSYHQKLSDAIENYTPQIDDILLVTTVEDYKKWHVWPKLLDQWIQQLEQPNHQQKLAKNYKQHKSD